MAGWPHWFNAHEFEQTLGDSEGQGSLVGWSSWGRKKLDMTATEQQIISKQDFIHLLNWISFNIVRADI